MKIGWSPKELVWLQAALTLPAYEFLQACEDIAGMSGRTVSAIAAKARSLSAGSRPNCAPYRAAAKSLHRAAPEPWILVQPTKADFMAGRARTKKHKP